MSYQTSIVEQFEFVTKTWVNRDNSPHDSAPTTGQDPLIGQSVRPRFVRCALDDRADRTPCGTMGRHDRRRLLLHSRDFCAVRSPRGVSRSRGRFIIGRFYNLCSGQKVIAPRRTDARKIAARPEGACPTASARSVTWPGTRPACQGTVSVCRSEATADRSTGFAESWQYSDAGQVK